jgi:hypothetical protein
VKPVFLLGCYGFIFHRSGNFGGGFEPPKPRLRYATGDGMVPLVWSSISCACVDITELKEVGGWGLWTWKPNVEQYCSFGCGSRVSGRARWRERGNRIGACVNRRYRSHWNTCDNTPQTRRTWIRQTKGKGKRCTGRGSMVR